MRHVASRLALVAVALALASLGLVRAQQETQASPAIREAVESERARAAVESILTDLRNPAPGVSRAGAFLLALERLVALGPTCIPFLDADVLDPESDHYDLDCLALGLIKGKASGDELRKALDAADRSSSPRAARIKMWMAYALAAHGDPEAVDRIDEGRLAASDIELMDRATALDVAAVLTSPESLPRLLARLDREAPKATERRLVRLLDAIGWTALPSAAEKVAPLAGHTDPEVRIAAARALGNLGERASAERLLALLDDPNEMVREEAALALEKLAPRSQVSRLVARLETERDATVRAAIYRTLAELGGETVLPTLRAGWSAADGLDRAAVADAVGRLGDRKGLNLLRLALRDPDLSVALQAEKSLVALGGPGALDALLALAGDPRWPLAQAAIQDLAEIGERRAGPRIADRLLRGYLTSPLTDLSRWSDVTILADALVDLRYADPLADLKEAVKTQTDPTVIANVEGLIKRLSAIAANGASREKWVEAAGSDDPAIRGLAFGRLAEIGGAESAAALAALFDRVEPKERPELLRAIGTARLKEGAPLVQRALLDETFDPYDLRPLREMAAFAAMRIGGPAMVAALRRSAERREGRDVRVLVYLSVLAGRDALPTLRSVRIPRFRYYEYERAREQVLLDDLVRDLEAGRSVRRYDAPPEEVELE